MEIVEAYKNYEPPINATAVVKDLLAYVPEKYLAGLKCIVLTNASGLPRNRRRRKAWYRGRKVLDASALGLYHQAWQGQAAWIEVFVDNVLEAWSPVLLMVPFVRDMAFADVVYHEIGHHVHKFIRPEYREQEDVAENWQEIFARDYSRKKYWYLIPLAYPLGLCIRLGKKIARKFERR